MQIGLAPASDGRELVRRPVIAALTHWGDVLWTANYLLRGAESISPSDA